jgi:hypothetical protein
MRLKLFAVLASIVVARIVSAVPVIPNVALIKGIVLECEVMSSTQLGMQPEQTIYRLTIEIESSEDVGQMPNLLKGKQGKDIAFYTKKSLPSDIQKKRIKAKVSFAGDERGGRWWVHEIEILD